MTIDTDETLSRIKKFFNKAKEIAITNGADKKFKHAAILFKGNSIVKSASNSTKTHPLPTNGNTAITNKLHAEQKCLYKTMNTEGLDLLVVRVNNQGDFAYSKPCSMCMKMITEKKLRRVYYSIGPNEFGVIDIFK